MTPLQAYWKARDAGSRLLELEHIVLTDALHACLYAQYVIGGRWIEAEDVIMNDVSESCYYAKYVIKSKLPEKMHNMMLLRAIEEPNDFWPKSYFEFISR